MSTPLAALWRITWPYLIGGVSHKVRLYVKSIGTVVGGVIQLTDRNLTDFDWTDAADDFVTMLSANMLDQSTSYGTVLLEQRSGALWNLMDTHTPSPSGSLTPYHPGSQYTIVLRDTSFGKVKVVLLETVWPAPNHFVTPTGGTDSHEDAFMGVLSGTGTHYPYMWIISRGGHFLAVSGAFVGGTITLNRKVRRRRGLT